MSDAFISQDQGVRVTAPTPDHAIAAELAAVLAHLTYVNGWAWSKLDDAELSSLSESLRILRELHAALTT